MQSLHIWGVKNAPLKVKNAKMCKQMFILQISLKMHLGVSHDQNLHIWQSKMPPKIAKFSFALNAPQVIWRLPLTKFAKSANLGVKNAHFGGQKCKNLQKEYFAQNSSQSHLGVSPDQNL